ncbi:MarR family transcriptional regulator [Dactylosporangium aurantiacum]|uniref:MarR family transcriptional regulator n=2 Tax=Dactylosporangium aurantiacum TaxID=35754 RepID=A0A9Q9MNQ0_9ACTN|nr:MarR family transcriptional regulator [Dactylosporangium aurantiacum]
MGVLTRTGAEHDLSLTQLRVLGILRDRRLQVTELAAYLGLDKSTMSGLIDRAERRGLLARDKNPDDRRAVDVYMTDAGQQLTARLHEQIQRALTPMIDRLDAAQQRRLIELLDAASAVPSSRAERAG